MNTKTRILALLITGTAALGLATSTHAALIAYEGFAYTPPGTSLNTLSGGSGWTTAWDNGGWRTPTTSFSENESTLSYSTLQVGGTSARAANDFDQSFRQFGTKVATGTYWISLLINVDTADVAGNVSLGLSLFDGGTERTFLGKAGSPNWGAAGQGGFNSSTAIVGNTDTFLVSRFNMDTGVAHHWLNPTIGSTPTDASAFNGALGTGFTAFAFDRVRLGRFGANGYLDEFRLGDTFADVSPIPEPSTVALLLGGLGVLFGIARRRRA